MNPPKSLYQIYDESHSRAYPKYLLEGCKNALFLFGAGFYGRNDACWAAEVGVQGCVVDTDLDKIDVMKKIYPADWRFLNQDVFNFVEMVKPRSYGIASIDCPISLIDKCWDMIPTWLSLVKRGVILATLDPSQKPSLDKNISFRYSQRSLSSWWVIFEKAGLILPSGGFYPHSFSASDFLSIKEFILGHDKITFVRENCLEPKTICIRHDVDHSINHALKFAQLEASNGIKSTYYLLPTADYFSGCADIALTIQSMGHEIGVHNDSVGASRGNAKLAIPILSGWIAEMRAWGLNVVGCADHGGEFNNSYIWKYIEPKDVGLEYEAYHLHLKSHFISDNRGMLNEDLIGRPDRPTHLSIHPEHWNLNDS